MVEAALAKNLLWDADQIRDFITAGAESLTVGGLLADPEFVIGLAWSLRHIDPANIVSTTIPFVWTPDGNNLAWTADSYAMLDLIRADQPIPGMSVTDASFATTVVAPSPTSSLDGGQGAEPTVDPLGACAVT
jgi:hypothetical protein